MVRTHPSIPRPVAVAAAVIGVMVLVMTIGLLHIGAGPAIFLSVIVILGHFARWSLHNWKRRLDEEQAWQS